MSGELNSNRVEVPNGRVTQIVQQLGALLELTMDDKKGLAEGRKLKLPADDKGESVKLFDEALELLSSGVLDEESTVALQSIVTAVDEIYDTGI